MFDEEKNVRKNNILLGEFLGNFRKNIWKKHIMLVKSRRNKNEK